jgi:hypothetical protein
MNARSSHGLRISQIVEWNNGGQGCIALIQRQPSGDVIVSRHRWIKDAQFAYKTAVRALKGAE